MMTNDEINKQAFALMDRKDKIMQPLLRGTRNLTQEEKDELRSISDNLEELREIQIASRPLNEGWE